MKKHGFRKRMSTSGERTLLKKEKSKGRKGVAVSKKSK
jgi:ribosomal protein L34